MSRIAIAGIVDFYNVEIGKQNVDAIFRNLTGLKEIVSGDDPGTEEMALWYAEANNIRFKSIPTLRDDIDGKPISEIGENEYGERYWINAGTIRNQQVVDYCSHLIAFLSKDDAVTRALISLATKFELKIRTVMIDELLE